MAVYALVKDNVVVNTIEWDGVRAFDRAPSVEVYPIGSLPPGVIFISPAGDDLPPGQDDV